jgi:pimeloyl-ACP methyl ester carboxylesterase
VRRAPKLLFAAVAALSLVFCASAPAAVHVDWMKGAAAPGTPARYDKVGVLKIGPARARNVLVLEPGTSGGSSYFVPLARWIVAREKGWQVWSVERRENLLEDQSVLNLAKRGEASPAQVFDYYLGYSIDKSITQHFVPVPNSSVEFAKQWGMKVAVGDLDHVIAAAGKLGGKVVLGGHSLGGDVVTAYATWNFGGHPGADQLSGLVYIDGGSFGAESAAAARAALASLDAPTASPWLNFGGIRAPNAGIFSSTGSLAALLSPNQPSLGQSSGLLTPFHLSPQVPVTNLAQYGYALNVPTSPPSLIAAQAHLGTGVATTGGPPFGWNGKGALTPIKRFAQMFSGAGIASIDGTEWYFPQRLTLDTEGVNNGLPSTTQRVLGLKTTMGRRLPRKLLIYAFGARLTGPGHVLLQVTRQLAGNSHIPARNLTLVNRPGYAHNDPAGAFPHNVFFSHLIRFLSRVAASRHRERVDRPVGRDVDVVAGARQAHARLPGSGR